MLKSGAAVVAGMMLVIGLTGCGTVVTTAATDPGAEKYLTSVKGVWIGTAPSDEDLIAYGKSACESLAEGTAIPDVVVLPEATGKAVAVASTGTDKNNWHVVRFAPAMCP